MQVSLTNTSLMLDEIVLSSHRSSTLLSTELILMAIFLCQKGKSIPQPVFHGKVESLILHRESLVGIVTLVSSLTFPSFFPSRCRNMTPSFSVNKSEKGSTKKKGEKRKNKKEGQAAIFEANN